MMLPSLVPIYMRVKRQGNQWVQSYSYDRDQWLTSVSFIHILEVTSSEIFIGNTGSGNIPACTGSIDHFFNTASPIDLKPGGFL